MGVEVIESILVKDDFVTIHNEVERVIVESDVVIVWGGSSVGEKDYTEKVYNHISENAVFVHGVSIKPGKPIIVGKNDGKPVFGLPGHPVSALNTFPVFVGRALRRITKQPEPVNRIVRAESESNFTTSATLDTYQMVLLNPCEGKTTFQKVSGKSGMITLLTKADGYIGFHLMRIVLKKGRITMLFF